MTPLHRRPLNLPALLLATILASCAHPPPPSSTPSPAPARCYLTGGEGLKLCHEASTEGVYYATPPGEVAYNVQILKLASGRYAALYHAEPYAGKERSGDSLKVGIQDAFSPSMPPAKRVIWGSLRDKKSPLYNGFADNPFGVSGGANPAAIRGRGADPYYYIYFLGVTGGSDRRPAGWRHVMLKARTKDFSHFEIAAEGRRGSRRWVPFGGPEGSTGRRPAVLRDAEGRPFRSHNAAKGDATQGLIGSVVFAGGKYYFFYYDSVPGDPGSFRLYYRTARDLRGADQEWSAERMANPRSLGGPSIVRVARAAGLDRWVLAYNCFRPTDQPGGNRSDICVQYTENLSVEGPGGISELRFDEGEKGVGYYLGLGTGRGLRSQHYFLTDDQGALLPPRAGAAGFLTWLDLEGQAIYGAKVNWAEWSLEPAQEAKKGATVRGP